MAHVKPTGAVRRKLRICGKVRVRTYAIAVASARTRYRHCYASRLFVVFYVKGVEFFDGNDIIIVVVIGPGVILTYGIL